SSDGKLLASGGKDAKGGTVKIWSLEPKTFAANILTLNIAPDAVTRVRFSADKTHLIVLAQDGSLRVFDVPAQNVISTILARLPSSEAEHCGDDAMCARTRDVLQKVAEWKRLTLAGDRSGALFAPRRALQTAHEVEINPAYETTRLENEAKAEARRAEARAAVTDAEILARAGRMEEADKVLTRIDFKSGLLGLQKLN